MNFKSYLEKQLNEGFVSDLHRDMDGFKRGRRSDKMKYGYASDEAPPGNSPFTIFDYIPKNKVSAPFWIRVKSSDVNKKFVKASLTAKGGTSDDIVNWIKKNKGDSSLFPKWLKQYEKEKFTEFDITIPLGQWKLDKRVKRA